MAKKKASTERKTFRKQDKELLKQPKGMCKVDFKEMAWLMALELQLKDQRRQEERIEYKPRRRN